MAQDSTSSAYDLIVVGSGATGGWAAKRAAEAGLRVALVEAGRKSADTDYREHVAASALPYRGRTKRPLERQQPQHPQSTYARSPRKTLCVLHDLRVSVVGVRERLSQTLDRSVTAIAVSEPGASQCGIGM